MQKAIRLAEIALSKDEIPVGAIIVKNEKIVGQGYNQKELLKDPTAHAEIIAITSAASTLNDWRLEWLYNVCDQGTMRNVLWRDN